MQAGSFCICGDFGCVPIWDGTCAFSGLLNRQFRFSDKYGAKLIFCPNRLLGSWREDF